jgi:antitoxin StbD
MHHSAWKCGFAVSFRLLGGAPHTREVAGSSPAAPIEFGKVVAMAPPQTVVPSSEARDHLSSYLKHFREKGGQAAPVVFGSHRKPEGVILSYERYEWQTEILDELVASEEVREAIAQDNGNRVELADVAREAGFDPAEFGL